MPERKTVVLTGASSGIGAAAARALVGAGHEVVLVGRSPARTQALADELGMRCMLADFEEALSVHDLAARLLEEVPRIDVLALNAGALYAERRRTIDGHERTWQVNLLSPTLLGRMLLERLRESRGRVVVTSSAVHRTARLVAGDLEGDRSGYSMLRSYGSAKLAGLLMIDEMLRGGRYAEIGFASFHPGYVPSAIWRDSPMLGRLLASQVTRSFWTPPEQAALPLQYLATEAPAEELDGGYWHGLKPRRIRHPQWDDVQLRASLREAVMGFDTAIV
ncbi:SDR family NAD(P)-dependent oxidoreductase [Agrococcus terreus]|uniref:SDR family NAD(P)-dependent oxidoreductase n=1 Tax=Agrococcus terreus TaxID=574649 RepID=UPI003850E590